MNPFNIFNIFLMILLSSTPSIASTASAHGATSPPPPLDLADAEEFTFETEVNKVMDILIHSLYKTKGLFLSSCPSLSVSRLILFRLI